jgi:hypothetical protein
MASGFVQRFKGKVNFAPGGLWVGGQPIYGGSASGTLALVSSSLGASTASQAINVLTSSGSTTQSILRLAKPPFAGFDMLIQMSTLSGLGLIVTASTAGAVTFNGTTATAMASTGNSTAVALELMATSTANWAIMGAYPGIFTSTGGTIWTFSTSS